MYKIKLLSTAILSLTIATASKAQFDYVKPDDLDQFHSRTLVVIVEKAADVVNEKLNKKHHKDQVDMYKSAIDTLNKNFANGIAQYWKISGGEVQYKTLDEVNDIEDKKNYAVLFCRTVGPDDLNSTYQAKNGVLWWPDFKEVAHDKDFSGKTTIIGMALLDRFNKTPFYQIPMPDIYPSKEDFKYALNEANNYLDYRINHRNDKAQKLDEQMLQENQQNLKDKTLLLRRDQLDRKLTEEAIKKIYPYPFMIAGKDTVDKAIDDNDTKYAIAMVVPCDIEVAPNGGFEYADYVYNIEDGAILASSGIPDMATNPKNANSANTGANKPLITKRALLDFCMYDSEPDDSGSKKKGKK